MYQLFSSSALVSLGLYQLINTTRNHLKSPQSYSAKPFHPFPSPSSNHRLKHLQLYLLILCLVIAFAHQLFISTQSDPLVKGHTPVHRLNSLQSAAVLFLFILLSLSLLLSDTASALLPFPHLTPVVAGQALTSRLLLPPAAGAWSWTVDFGSSLQNSDLVCFFFLSFPLLLYSYLLVFLISTYLLVTC